MTSTDRRACWTSTRSCTRRRCCGVAWALAAVPLRAGAGEPEVHDVPADDGRPVRARLTVTFNEFIDAEREAREVKRQTADFTKVTRRGRRARRSAAIAGRFYEDPQMWRPIALANGIDDPRALATGQSLLDPAAAVPRPGDGRGAALTWPAIPTYAPEFALRINGERAAGGGALRGDQRALPGRPATPPTGSRSASPTRTCAGSRSHIRGLGFQPVPDRRQDRPGARRRRRPGRDVRHRQQA